MKKLLLTALHIVVITLGVMAQNKLDYIVFEKPYTGSLETNLYKAGPIKFDFRTQYNNLKKSDINEDLNRAIKNRDFRFIAISGFSYLLPGFKGKQHDKALKSHNFKVIMGTSDAIDTSEPPLQSVAHDYAENYNKLLLSKIHELKYRK
jgi:hypothetical protein